VQYLNEAAKLLHTLGFEFRLVGKSQLSQNTILELSSRMQIIGPVSRERVAEHYDWADVLVLPTLSEGSANVIYEGMAVGLPVVTTNNAGSVIVSGHNGLIVPARDAKAIASALMELRNNGDLAKSLGDAARRSAAVENFDSYTARLVHAVGEASLR
jgi:glycosyltransferase involved in cell wall biosynthesis